MTRTSTLTTEERINRTHRANRQPDVASKDDIAAALEGRKLADGDLMQSVEPHCSRCRDKNEKRRLAGIEDADPYIEDGDRVEFYAVFEDPDDLTTRKHWRVLSVLHERHPHPPIEKVEESGTDLIHARARVHKTESHEHLVDVDVIDRSPMGDGPVKSVVQNRRDQHIDHTADAPGDITVLDVPPEDPFADWVESERQWLRDLIAQYGPLERDTEYPAPVFGYGDGADDDDRTETKRFTSEDAPFDATDLITGDRIDPSLVAPTMDLLGDTGATCDESATQLARATRTRHHDDIHRAILVDGESGLLVRANCHDSLSARSQQEEDWKVREIGERITVDSVIVQHDPADEWTGDNITDMAADWANLVLQDKARGATGYEDELTLISVSSTLKMRDPTSAVVHATIDIDGDGGISETDEGVPDPPEEMDDMEPASN